MSGRRRVARTEPGGLGDPLEHLGARTVRVGRNRLGCALLGCARGWHRALGSEAQQETGQESNGPQHRARWASALQTRRGREERSATTARECPGSTASALNGPQLQRKTKGLFDGSVFSPSFSSFWGEFEPVPPLLDFFAWKEKGLTRHMRKGGWVHTYGKQAELATGMNLDALAGVGLEGKGILSEVVSREDSDGSTAFDLFLWRKLLCDLSKRPNLMQFPVVKSVQPAWATIITTPAKLSAATT